MGPESWGRDVVFHQLASEMGVKRECKFCQIANPTYLYNGVQFINYIPIQYLI